MPKIVNIDLLNSIRKPKEMVDEMLDKQVEQLEGELGKKAKGIGNKVLSLFVKGGNRVQLTIEEVADHLWEKKGLNRTQVDGILFTLVKSGILRQTKGDRLELANNFLAQRADQKIEAENRVLRTIRATIQDRMSRNETLDEQYLNYIAPSLGLLDLNEEEKKFVEKSQAVVRRNRRILRGVITVLFLLLLGMTYWAIVNYWEAAKNYANEQAITDMLGIKNSELEKTLMELAEEKAKSDSLLEVANDALRKAEIARVDAENAEAEARRQAANALRQKGIADSLRIDALQARDSLLLQTKELIRLREVAEASRKVADENRLKAEALSERALLLNKVITSRIAANRTLQLSDERTRALVALEAYTINRDVPEIGDEYHPSIFKALYTAAQALDESLEYNNEGSHLGSIRKMVVTDDGQTLYSAGSDGRINRWSIAEWDHIGKPKSLKRTALDNVIPGGVQHVLSVSPDNNRLLVAGQPPFMQVVDRSNGRLVDTISSPGGLDEIFVADFMGQNELLAMSRSHAYQWDGSRLLKLGKMNSSVGFTMRRGGKTTIYSFSGSYADNKYALKIETFDGQSTSVDEYNFFDRSYAQEVNFGQVSAAKHRQINDTLGYTVYGFSSGKMMVLRVDPKDDDLFLGFNDVFLPHRAAISDISFSPSGQFMALTSYDRSVTVWDMQRYRDPAYEPITFDNLSGWAMSLAFVGEDKMAVGCSDGNLYFFSLQPGDYARFICETLEANQEVTATEQREIYKDRRDHIDILDYNQLSFDDYTRFFGSPDRKEKGKKPVKIYCEQN